MNWTRRLGACSRTRAGMHEAREDRLELHRLAIEPQEADPRLNERPRHCRAAIAGRFDLEAGARPFGAADADRQHALHLAALLLRLGDGVAAAFDLDLDQ